MRGFFQGRRQNFESRGRTSALDANERNDHGADVFSVLEKVVERTGLPWEKFVCLATDGAT